MKTIVFNKKGMTLAETIIGVAVLSISLVIIVSTQLSIKNEMNKLDTKIQGKIEVLGGEKLILFDIQAASLSFNNINIADNNSKNFFDYLPEKSAGLVSNNPDRILTLAVGRKTEIIFLLQDTKKGSVLIYDPVAAYNIGAASDNFNVAATLTFSSLNKGNFVSNQRAQFWNNGQILFLDTMARIRTPAAAVDMNIPPRSSIFIGKVNGSALETIAEANPFINSTHPEKTDFVISSADTFLRTVSSFGGGISTVRMQAARLIKYHIITTAADTKFFKSTYDGTTGRWINPILISDKIQQVIFQRDSIGSKIINFRISKVN